MKKLISTLLTLLASSIVYALPHHTIITDSFDQMVQAMTFTTDLLNNNAFDTLYYTSVVFALTGTLAIKKWRALMNHNEPFTIGDVIGKLIVTIILFAVMRHPYSDDLLIVDKVNRQQQNFQHVPSGVAIPVILSHSFIANIDYVIDKYGSPIVPLEYGGNGVTFSLLFELNKFPDKFKAQFPYIDQSLNNYMNKCYKIGLHTGYISNVTTTGDFFGSLHYPNYYFSTDYFDATGNSSRLSCIDFYDQLKRDLADPKVKQTFCNKLLGTTVTGSQCDNILDHNVKQLISPNYANPSNIIVDTLIADHVTQAYSEKANRQMYTQGLMQSLMADNWIPQLQTMMLTLTIMLPSLLLIFLPYAPIKVFMWYAGLYMWLILWHGIDAIMGVQYQHQLVNALKAYGDDISVDKLVSAPTEAMQVAVQYGKQRWQSMSMALGLAGVIGFSVNSAISGVAGASGQSAQSNADSAGSALGGSAGLSGAKQQMFNETTSAQAFNNVVSQSNGNQSYYDNASMQQTVSTLDAQGVAKGKLDAVKDMANVSSTSEYTSSTQTQQSLGQADVANEKANALGTGLRHSTALQNGEVLSQTDVNNLKDKGISGATAGMSVEGLAVSSDNGGTVSNMNLTGATAKGAISQTLDSKGDIVKSTEDGDKIKTHDVVDKANKLTQRNVTDQANVDIEANKIQQRNVITQNNVTEEAMTTKNTSTLDINDNKTSSVTETTTGKKDTVNEGTQWDMLNGRMNEDTFTNAHRAKTDEAYREQLATQLASTLASKGVAQHSIEEQSSIGAKGGIQAPGFVTEVTGISLGAEASSSLGTNDQTQFNENRAKIMDALENSKNELDTMKKLQEINKDFENENVSHKVINDVKNDFK